MTKLKLVKTCDACPEQYDGYIDGERVAYLRLRHGNFDAEYRNRRVFTGCPEGDGIFDPDERTSWLQKASLAILEAHEEYKNMKLNLAFEIVPEDEID